MKLYVNGCSFCFGAELKDHKTESFPNLIKKELDCELVDDSSGGSSNQKILRETLNRDLTDDYFVIIGWSGIFRYERLASEERRKQENVYTDNGWENFVPLHDKYDWPTQPIDWYVIGFLNQVLALQNYLKYKNIPFFFFNSFEQIQEIMWEHQDKSHKVNTNYDFSRYYKHIDEDTFPSLFDEKLIWTNYIDYTNGNGTTRSGGHPSKENHEDWAKYLIETCKLGELK